MKKLLVLFCVFVFINCKGKTEEPSQGTNKTETVVEVSEPEIISDTAIAANTADNSIAADFFSEEGYHELDKYRAIIEGVWFMEQFPDPDAMWTEELNYSWGKSLFPHGAISIDLHRDPPRFASEFPAGDIVSITEKENKVKLVFFFDTSYTGEAGGILVPMLFNFNDDNTMWIEMGNDFSFLSVNKAVYYKIGGSEF
jgi:hypothetical protein